MEPKLSCYCFEYPIVCWSGLGGKMCEPVVFVFLGRSDVIILIEDGSLSSTATTFLRYYFRAFPILSKRCAFVVPIIWSSVWNSDTAAVALVQIMPPVFVRYFIYFSKSSALLRNCILFGDCSCSMRRVL